MCKISKPVDIQPMLDQLARISSSLTAEGGSVRVITDTLEDRLGQLTRVVSWIQAPVQGVVAHLGCSRMRVRREGWPDGSDPDPLDPDGGGGLGGGGGGLGGGGLGGH